VWARRIVRGFFVYNMSMNIALTRKELDRLVTALGQAIRKLRLAKGLSQEALAEMADFDRTYISLLERGARNPSFSNLCRVAAALGITPSDLLEGIVIDSKPHLKGRLV
jgi:ribosome-binding protein aMBF1 (putative translation factor)